jgi:drug/metabolite transporter (DMT)-like permease
MLAIVGSSLSYSLSSIFTRKQLQDVSPTLISTGQFTFAFAYILPFSLFIDRPFSLTPSGQALLSWVILSLLGTVIAYNIFYLLLKRTNATFTVSVTYILPIFGLILGAIFLNEPLNPIILFSLVLILSGVLLVRVKDSPRPNQSTTTIPSVTET